MQRLGRGRAHFHLWRDQFSSDSQTVWDGRLLKCNEAVNFFVWPSDVWKLRFWTIFKKVWQKMDSWGRRFSQKNFQKIQKKWWNFFSLFLFLLCSIERIMFPRLDLMTQNQFYTRYIVREFVKSRCDNDVIIYKNIEKIFDIFWTFWWFV